MKKNLSKLTGELRKELQDDILTRYDCPEYWDYDIIEVFFQDEKLSGIEKNEIEKLLGD